MVCQEGPYQGERAAIALPHPPAMLDALLRRSPRERPMCRWIAYRGETIPLEQYVTAPAHSLVVQSQRSLESTAATNGDGFGMGWYGEHAEPGLYREVRREFALPLPPHPLAPLFRPCARGDRHADHAPELPSLRLRPLAVHA